MYKGKLPGYTWDDEKRKYFKIEADHYAAGPSTAKYTKAAIEKKETEHKKRKREEQWDDLRQRVLVSRAPEFRVPKLAGVSIFGELGLQQNQHRRIWEERSGALIRALKPDVVLAMDDERISRIRKRESFDVSQFDFDGQTNAMILGVEHNVTGPTINGVSVLPMLKLKKANDGASRYAWPTAKPVSWVRSQISSINMSKTTRAFVATSTGDQEPPSVLMSAVKDLDDFGYAADESYDVGCHSSYKPKEVTTIWCSAINPWISSSNHESIAVGTSNEKGIEVLRAPNDGSMSKIWQNSGSKKTFSDVLSVDWLSPNVLAAGLRDATVTLYDIRSNSGVKRMKHTGGIPNLKRADVDTRFVVTGFGSKMALYDLRALREEDARPQPPQMRKGGPTPIPGYRSGLGRIQRAKSGSIPRPKNDSEGVVSADVIKWMNPAQPVMTFQYNNEYDLLGMDVSASLGVVAAAESGGKVRVSSLITGKIIKEWNCGDGRGKVSCVRFIENAQGVTKVMASCGAEIVEFSVAGPKTKQNWRGDDSSEGKPRGHWVTVYKEGESGSEDKSAEEFHEDESEDDYSFQRIRF